MITTPMSAITMPISVITMDRSGYARCSDLSGHDKPKHAPMVCEGRLMGCFGVTRTSSRASTAGDAGVVLRWLTINQ